MLGNEPPREWQEQLHQRILQNEPTAFAQLCEAILPHLVSFLRARYPHQDDHLHEMVAIDCLMDYRNRVDLYDPGRLSLFGFLRMAANWDMVNAIDKQQRQDRRLVNIDDPSVQPRLPQGELLTDSRQLAEWLQQHTAYSREEILAELEAELEPVDQHILLLMLEGVRESERYADVMGVSHLPEVDQRLEVKRAKDRIAKKLHRFGKRFDRQ